MIIDLNEIDLIKATTWREELHKRDSTGRFAKQVGTKAIRKGSKVVAKNGVTGKVVDSTDTHYHIEKDDGKQSKVLKHNVLHEDEHRELTAPKKGTKANDKKVSTKPKTATKGVRPGTTDKPVSTGKSTSTAKPSTAKSGGKATAGAKKASKPATTGTAKKTAPKPPNKADVATAKGDKASATKKTTPKRASEATKKPASKPAGATKPATGANKKAPASKPKTPTAKTAVKDIRSEVQKNRTLAYDVGDKVGGARKDDYEKSFREKPTLENLASLEKENGALAEKLVTKANILPKFSFEDEQKNGTELQTAIMKKLIFDRISPKPQENTPEGRKAYMDSMQKLQRHIAGVKSWDNMRNAIRELSDIGYKAKQASRSESSLARYTANPASYSYINTEYHEKTIAEGNKARAMLDMTPLGDKLEGFFTSASSRESSFNTVSKNTKEGWDKYLSPATPKGKATGAKRGGENKVWEREAVSEDKRTGGKKIKVDKPEDLIKQFGVRGVEFGHWVNDSSGKYHLQRCAEAFSDLADTIGVDPKDISLNGRLAIAFGARGKAGALAHYEPAKKVINMTKYGGAGSLAHEWGHAMDNIMQQYSNGGTESLGMASDSRMGDNDPKLALLYDNLMSSIKKPIPGEPGVMQKVRASSETQKTYSPSVARILKMASSDEEGIKAVIAEWQQADYRRQKKVETFFRMAQEEPDPAKRKAIEKGMNKAIRERKTAKDQVAGNIAYGMYLKNDRKEHWDGVIELPVGTSEYMHRMTEMDDGSVGKYFSKNVEMFARVFESYIQDKMKSNKQDNNYLVHGTGEGAVRAVGAPFPIGKEREQMFKAMENLLKHISSKGTLKKALILEVLASGRGDMTEELRKSVLTDAFDNLWKQTLDKDVARLKELGVNTTGLERKRSAYNVASPEEVIYIPVNRLRVVYQTEQATNWDKVRENAERMQAGENLEPVTIGLDYDVHDGHHRLEATKLLNYEHVPCVVKGGNEIEQQRAVEAYREVWKSFTEADHPRDSLGKFSKVYHTTKDPNFKHDPNYKNSGQEWGSGLYTAPAKDVEYWHKALKDPATGEGHTHVIPMDISEAKLIHTHEMPDRMTRAKMIMKQYGSGKVAKEALEDEEKNFVTGETYGMRPHEIAEYRLYAKMFGYDGLVAHDEKEGHQVVLFDDSKVKYQPAITMDEFIQGNRWGKM